ncbi:TLC domain-containing protein 1 [Hippocampus comes]|uniref:TLC domain containing 1 n=1 Tax=Hippocampus comes TaxID=109280 RepID=A0A3Q2YT76_HIPCM|nr:PREDICTED: calfacilitin [Hippocampus comes]XP_019723863.1 PREDICTED: calfacilitin [Hippocampus comes]
MEALVAALKRHPGPSVVLFAVLFRVVHGLLGKVTPPKVVASDEFQAWKWKNLSLSMVHSTLTGTWAVSSVLLWPETLSDLHFYHTPLSYLLVCISTGYFVHDTADIIGTGNGRRSWEFLIHHALVLSCFLYTLYTQLYVAGAVMVLLVEVNSVTLHLRLLLKMVGATSSAAYRLNKVLNVCTFVAVRLATQFYITWYISANYSKLDHAAFFMACVMAMNVIMLVYLYRLIRSDFLPRAGGPHADRNGTHNSKKFVTD